MKKCKICGESFSPYRSTDRFCSSTCAYQHKPKKYAKSEKLDKEEDPSLLDLYNEIWSTRPHRSEISGEPLLPKGHILWVNQFMHILGKRFKKWKYAKHNIMLGLPEEHDKQERYSVFMNKQQEKRLEYFKEFENIKL